MAESAAARVPARLPCGAGKSSAYRVSSGGIAGPRAVGTAGPGLRLGASWATTEVTQEVVRQKARTNENIVARRMMNSFGLDESRACGAAKMGQTRDTVG